MPQEKRTCTKDGGRGGPNTLGVQRSGPGTLTAGSEPCAGELGAYKPRSTAPPPSHTKKVVKMQIQIDPWILAPSNLVLIQQKSWCFSGIKTEGLQNRGTTYNRAQVQPEISDHTCPSPHAFPLGSQGLQQTSALSPESEILLQEARPRAKTLKHWPTEKEPEYTGPVHSCRSSNQALSSLFSYLWYTRFTGHLRKASNVHEQTQINRRQQHGRYSRFLDSSKT